MGILKYILLIGLIITVIIGTIYIALIFNCDDKKVDSYIFQMYIVLYIILGLYICITLGCCIWACFK